MIPRYLLYLHLTSVILLLVPSDRVVPPTIQVLIAVSGIP